MGQETSKMHTELNKIISIVISVIKKIKQNEEERPRVGNYFRHFTERKAS